MGKARQANRYRRIGEQVRRFEGIQFFWLNRRAETGLATASADLATANARVAGLTEGTAQASVAQAAAAEQLPALRQGEAEAAAALHRLAVARDALDQDEQRVVEAREQLTARREQTLILKFVVQELL